MNLRLLTQSLTLGALLATGLCAEPMAVVVRTKGSVQVGPEGNAASAARSGDIIQAGWQVSTGDDGRVLVRFLADQSIAEIKPGSVVVFSRRVREDDVSLRRVFVRAGEAAFGITPGKGKDLRFESATTVASVRGTQFRFKVDHDTTRVGVAEGVVKICHSADGKTAHVGAGSSVAVTQDAIALTSGTLASDSVKAPAGAPHQVTVDFAETSGTKTFAVDWQDSEGSAPRKLDPSLFQLLDK